MVKYNTSKVQPSNETFHARYVRAKN